MNIFDLIKNEKRKNKLISWLILYSLLMAIIIIVVSVNENRMFVGKWDEKVSAKIITNRELLLSEDDVSKRKELTFENEILRYRLINNIPPYDNYYLFLVKKVIEFRYAIVTILIILTSYIFGAEYANKTILLFFTQGINRDRLIISKLLFCVCEFFEVAFLTFAIVLVGSWAIVKEKNNSEYSLFVINDRIYLERVANIILILLLILSLYLLSYINITNIMCIFFKNQSMPILISLLLSFFGGDVTGIFPINDRIKELILPNVLDKLINCVESTEIINSGQYQKYIVITLIYNVLIIFITYWMLKKNPFN